MTLSLLARVSMGASRPHFGWTEAFNADAKSEQGQPRVGVYYDENGKVPLLECVRHAERQLVETASPRGYLPIDGMPAYDQAVRVLLFGAQHPAVVEKRVVTVQALGGTGGLKVGADFLRRVAPAAEVWISDPSWENHRAPFRERRLHGQQLPYYDPATRGLDLDAMLKALRAMPEGAIVVLHACCHNPTGVDLTAEQWTAIRDVVIARGLVPFLDWPTKASRRASTPMPARYGPLR